MAALTLQWQRLVVVTEAIWHKNLKYLLFGHIQEKKLPTPALGHDFLEGRGCMLHLIPNTLQRAGI